MAQTLPFEYKYGVKEVMDVIFWETVPTPLGKKDIPIIEFDTLKISNLENAAENVSAMGGKGNARLVTWDFGRTATLTLQDALMSMQSLALMAGTEIEEAQSQIIYKRETIRSIDWNISQAAVAGMTPEEKEAIFNSAEEVLNKQLTVGTGTITNFFAKFGFIFKSSDPNRVIYLPDQESRWQPGTTAGTWVVVDDQLKFTDFINSTYVVVQYLDKTSQMEMQKVLTLATASPVVNPWTYYIHSDQISLGEGGGYTLEMNIPAGVEPQSVKISYKFVSDARKTKTVTISADKFPGTYKITGDTWIRNANTKKDEAWQLVIPSAKLQAGFTLTMQAEGDPSVFDMTIDVERDITSTEMVKMIKY